MVVGGLHPATHTLPRAVVLARPMLMTFSRTAGRPLAATRHVMQAQGAPAAPQMGAMFVLIFELPTAREEASTPADRASRGPPVTDEPCSGTSFLSCLWLPMPAMPRLQRERSQGARLPLFIRPGATRWTAAPPRLRLQLIFLAIILAARLGV